MVGHIYGRNDVVIRKDQPHMFIKELDLYYIYIDSTLPYIVARGRKGGSNVAAAIVNALFYMAQRTIKNGADVRTVCV